jgi:hypothetical protein
MIIIIIIMIIEKSGAPSGVATPCCGAAPDAQFISIKININTLK